MATKARRDVIARPCWFAGRTGLDFFERRAERGRTLLGGQAAVFNAARLAVETGEQLEELGVLPRLTHDAPGFR